MINNKKNIPIIIMLSLLGIIGLGIILWGVIVNMFTIISIGVAMIAIDAITAWQIAPKE